jgi:hypothetical protein
VPISIYFYEQILELFFVNTKLVLWALGLALSVSLIYYLFCFMLYNNTLGGMVTRLEVVTIKTNKSPKLWASLLIAFGAYCGTLLLLWGPLFAWWLDGDHRGWAEKLSKTIWRAKYAYNEQESP